MCVCVGWGFWFCLFEEGKKEGMMKMGRDGMGGFERG